VVEEGAIAVEIKKIVKTDSFLFEHLEKTFYVPVVLANNGEITFFMEVFACEDDYFSGIGQCAGKL
jgi:hypothetical protein